MCTMDLDPVESGLFGDGGRACEAGDDVLDFFWGQRFRGVEIRLHGLAEWHGGRRDRCMLVEELRHLPARVVELHVDARATLLALPGPFAQPLHVPSVF